MAKLRWRPRPVRPILPASTATGFAGAPAPNDFKVVSELALVRLDGRPTVVQATRPDAPGRFPVLIFCHGAGTGNHTAFDEHCAVLARRGLACLVADKDLAAYSTLRRDYGHLARQYADLAEWGRRQPWALDGRVGYYAESEGAWPAPWAATLSPASFLALVSAPVVSPRRQALYAIGNHLRSVGAPAALFDAGVRFARATMPRGWLEYIDFDADPYFRRLDCPVFMAYGAADLSMPVVEAARRIMAEAAGPVAVRYYADADHGLRRGPDSHVSTTFLEDLAAWAACLAAGLAPDPKVAGASPVQPFAAVDPPRGGPIATDAWAGLPAVAGLALAAAANRRQPAACRRPLAVAGWAALGAAAAQAAYLGLVFWLASRHRTAPAAIRAGHWIVRGLGGLSLAAGAVAARRLPSWPSRRAGAGAALGLGAAGVVLALARRWGAFGRIGQNDPGVAWEPD
ncbi:MAG: hypothetical protein LBG60_11015 [Bifidobacteriaceae bacterium]|jgi:hypothetical protein|nr:hypothetical protein [Bifidobacteriaceae bacterium]